MNDLTIINTIELVNRDLVNTLISLPTNIRENYDFCIKIYETIEKNLLSLIRETKLDNELIHYTSDVYDKFKQKEMD